VIDPDYLEFLARVEYANPLPVAPPSPEVAVEQDGPESKPGPLGSRSRRLMRERERFKHVHADPPARRDMGPYVSADAPSPPYSDDGLTDPDNGVA
jgi:hypothetical protein